MAIEKTNNSIQRNGFREAAARFYLPALKLSLVAAICLVVSLAADAANFTASLDRDSIALGETATLSLSFEGGQPQSVPTPNVPGLEFESSGNSQNFSFINGQMSSVVTVTFSVSAQQAGEFVIRGMSVDIGGQHLSTQPLKLTVTRPGAPSLSQINSGSEIAFMRFLLPQKKVYPGEMLAGQLQVFFRDDVQNEGNFQIAAMPADGLTVGKMAEGGRQRTQIGNRLYTVIPISVALTATKTGTVSLGPVSVNVTIVVAGEGGQWGPFGGFGGEQKQLSLVADQVNAASYPLPMQNVPSDFNGAVGDYTMNVTAGPTQVAVGDPVTIRVQISGRGAIDSLVLPNQTGWNNFKIFSPTSKVQATDDLGDEGSKTFEEIVTPEIASVHELPPFSFSYFSPDDGNYHTLTHPATPLSVTSAGATQLPAIAGAKQSGGENQTPQDISPIRENLGAFAQASVPLITRPAFLALQSLPVIAFLAALVWRKRADNLANNPRLRRQRAVAQLIAGGLDDLNQYAAENKSNEFFAMLFRLLQEQLGERLDCPAIAITEADVDARLIALGAKPETLNSLRELFQACNQARYAPVQTSQELSALAAKFKKTVEELQHLKI